MKNEPGISLLRAMLLGLAFALISTGTLLIVAGLISIVLN